MAKVLLGDDSTNTWRNLTPLHLHYCNGNCIFSSRHDRENQNKGQILLFLSEFIANIIEYQYILQKSINNT